MQNIHSALLAGFVGIFLATLPGSLNSAAAAEEPATRDTSGDASFDKARFEQEVTLKKDLPNFHEVHPFLYRSGAPSVAGLQDLKARGFKTIIDLRAPSERKFDEPAEAKQLGLKYINLVMSSQAPTPKQIQVFLQTVKSAQAHPENGPVLVHCAHGSDRTGCLVGIWRVKEDGWSYEEAYKEMRHYWFSPKFTNLSGTVRQFATSANAVNK